MRVFENNADRLRLRSVPYRLAGLLAAITLGFFAWSWALFNAGEPKGGMALAVVGTLFLLGCFGAFVRVLTVTLDRGEAVAEVVQSGIFGRTRQIHSLAEIHGATLQSTVIKRRAGDLSQERRSGRKFRPERRVWRAAFARGAAAPIPLTEVYGSETEARAIAAAINAWFGSSR